MKTVIVFGTKYGATAKCASLIVKELATEAKAIPVKEYAISDIEACENVLIGGSIYYGNVQKEVRVFCQEHLPLLLQKGVGLFLCHVEQGMFGTFIDNNFPPTLVDHARTLAYLGYEININKPNFIERYYLRKGLDIETSCYNLEVKRIANFASRFMSDNQLN